MPCRIAALLLPLALVVSTACSPALNWREARLPGGELRALLPCKPDQASRRQSLAGQDTELTMAGCKAAGALFAVSVADVAQEGRAQAVQAQWQAQLLANLRATASTTTAYAIKGAAPHFEPLHLSASGRSSDGRPLQTQAVWFARGTRLYHAAIYAERISSDMSDPFFGGLELP
jgi:hypothetical protein